jgi:hypothetical protein
MWTNFIILKQGTQNDWLQTEKFYIAYLKKNGIAVYETLLHKK